MASETRQQSSWLEWHEVERHLISGVRVLDIANDFINRGLLLELEKSYQLTIKNKKQFFSLLLTKILTFRKRRRLQRSILKTASLYIKPAVLIEKIGGGSQTESSKSRVNWLAYLYDYFMSVGYNWTFDEFLQLRWDSIEEFRLASQVRRSRDALYWIDIHNMTDDGVNRLNSYPRRKVTLTREQRIADIRSQFDSLKH